MNSNTPTKVWAGRALCVVAALCASAPAFGRVMSDAEQQRIRRAYANFQKRGDIPSSDAPSIPWKRAIKYDSRYYKIRTNTTREVAAYIGTIMDAQAVAMRKIFRFPMSLRRINIWATRTRSDFVDVAYKELRLRIGPSTGGFWTNARGGTICLPYVKAHNLHPGNVMMHEATHQFLHAALGREIPIWLNEGLAVMFEDSKYNPVKRKLEVFIVPRARLRGLQWEMQAGRNVTLEELFRTPQMMFTSRHYGAAWSFCYWVFRSSTDNHKETLRRQKAFNAYLYDVKAKKSDVSRLFAYLGMKRSAVEKEWKEWVLSLDPNDERGGTRLKGEPPYTPPPKRERAPEREGDESTKIELPPELVKMLREGKEIPPELLKKLIEEKKRKEAEQKKKR